MEQTPAIMFQIQISVDDREIGALLQKQQMGQPVIHFMISDGHHVRRQKVHDFNCGNTFIFRVDKGTLKHIPRDSINHILFFPAHFVDVAGQHGNAAYQFIVHFFYQKISMQVIGMKQSQFF